MLLNIVFLFQTVVDYDMAAIAIALLLYLSIYLRHLNKSKSSKIFRALLILVILSCLLNIGSTDLTTFYVSKNVQAIDHNFVFSKFMFSLNFLFRYSVIVLFLIYVLSYTQSIKKLLRKHYYDILIFTPFALFIGALIANLWTGILFSFKLSPGGDLIFVRGPAIKFSMEYEIYYMLFIFINIIRNRKLFEKSQLFSLFLIIPVRIITIIFRVYHPSHQIELLGVALCLLFIIQTIEAPELLIDSKTGLNSIKQFNILVKKRFIYKDEYSLFIININNFSEIYSNLSFEDATAYVSSISRMINVKSTENDGIAVSITDGLYSVLFDSKVSIDVLRKFYVSLKEMNLSRFFLNITAALISIPNDFKSEAELYTFIDNFHNFKNDNYYDYGEMKTNRDFVIAYNIESIVEEAFKRGQFRINYQPIYSVKEKRFVALEALSRIDSPKYGIIEPDSFIPFAEKRGSISTIDLYVYESVLKLVKSEKLDKYGIRTVTINLSMVDFNTSDFIEKFVELTTRYNVDTNKIKLEITETNEYRLDNLFFARVQILKNLGFEFILDDYGTGYSNLEKFAKLPMVYVKLDKNLIKLAKDDNNKLVLKTTFNMIHDLNRYSIIEGIETEEELKEVLEFGCNFVQGNYYSEPLEIEEAFEFLKDKEE